MTKKAKPQSPTPAAATIQSKTEEFRRAYGAQWYSIATSPMGRALLAAMRECGPAAFLSKVQPSAKTENAALYLGRIEGFESACVILETHLFEVPPPIDDLGDATYQGEE